MPDIATVLKAEIARIARRETKAAVANLQKSTGKARKAWVDTKSRLAELERQVKALKSQLAKPATQMEEDTASADSLRMTGKRVKSLRGRLGVTQAQFALLVGVTPQAVYHWEQQAGSLKLRSQTKAGLALVRGLRAREARARLEELTSAKKARAKTARRRRI